MQPSPPKLLLVDDVPANLVALEALIHDLGYTIVTAGSGEEALRHLLRDEFAVLLLDVQMPGMDGFEVAQHVRMRAATRDIGIIFLTAYESKQNALRGYDSGAFDVVFKPIDREILRGKLRAFVELHESKRELAAANAQLKVANDELRHAYAELQTAQSGLVQAAKMASLGVLVAGVAHEINNPLAFVMNHVRTAIKQFERFRSSEGSEPDGARQASFQIGRARLDETLIGLERISDLVLKLRTFSRLDEGERKTVSVRESVSAVLAILNHRLRDRIELRMKLNPPDSIECYPALFNQVLLNLLANASDSITGAGMIELWAGAEDDMFELRVVDNGCGLPQNARERLFEPFFTTKPIGEGTGLGLSISYGIVKKHGGTLELSDTPGGGTTARVRIPLQQSQAAFASAAAS